MRCEDLKNVFSLPQLYSTSYVKPLILLNIIALGQFSIDIFGIIRWFLFLIDLLFMNMLVQFGQRFWYRRQRDFGKYANIFHVDSFSKRSFASMQAELWNSSAHFQSKSFKQRRPNLEFHIFINYSNIAYNSTFIPSGQRRLLWAHRFSFFLSFSTFTPNY